MKTEVDLDRQGESGDGSTFAMWAILELMGHRRLAGWISEATIGGGSFIRIDIPAADSPAATQFYSPNAVYAITPTTEELARRIAINDRPAPVHPWQLPAPEPEQARIRDDDDPF